VAVAGMLNVVLVDNFVPAQGDSFPILTYVGTLAGDFDTKNFPTLGNGNVFETSAGNGSYTLLVAATAQSQSVLSHDPAAASPIVGTQGTSSLTITESPNLNGKSSLTKSPNLIGSRDRARHNRRSRRIPTTRKPEISHETQRNLQSDHRHGDSRPFDVSHDRAGR
jgi:hypothetical protein